MKYSGNFKSVLKDKDYTVDIITKGSSSGGTVQLTFGPDAFVTNMDAGSNTIYVPVKYQSATIQIVSNSYHFDMYSSTPKENTVALKDTSTGKVLWTGYISCNVYDADYNFVTESWGVECVDRLSVLKNYDYVFNNGTSKEFVSFADIINNCLTLAGFNSTGTTSGSNPTRDKWYISRATHIPGKTYLVDNLYISEQNFFNEDDEPMKMSEVLEEICKYMGVTAVQDGSTVYFLDYDAIKAGNFNFTWYYIKSSTKHNVTLASSDGIAHTILKESYSSTGTRLSLDNVYSKVTVRDSLYPVKSIIPSLFEDEDLVNVHATPTDPNWNYEFNTQCVFGGKESWLQSWEKRAEDDVYFKIKSRFYENRKYIHHYFRDSFNYDTLKWESTSTTDKILNGLVAEEITGVSFAKYSIGSGNTPGQAYVGMDYDSFDNYLMIPCNHSTVTNRLRLEARDEFAKPFFMSGRTKILVNGEMILTDRGLFPNSPQADNNANIGYWPHTGTFHSEFDGNWFKGQTLNPKQGVLNLEIGLSIGDVEKDFKVPFYPYGESEKRITESSSKHEVFYVGHQVQDNVSPLDCIKENGYILNMQIDSSTVYPAKPKLKIYGMDDMATDFYIPPFMLGSPLACLFIKDFDIIAVDPCDGGDDTVNATDTEYTYTIDDEFSQELSPIEFKVCTSDGKSLNYSSVAVKDASGNYQFVDTLVNDALSSKLTAAGENTAQRSENLMCFKLVKQYESPCKKLNINLFDEHIKPWTCVTDGQANGQLAGISFIVNTISHNYSMDTATCELVEKK